MDIKPRNNKPRRPSRRPLTNRSADLRSRYATTKPTVRAEEARPKPKPQPRPEQQKKSSEDNDWSAFYSEQAAYNSDVLWVEREKEKIDWKATLQSFAKRVLEVHDNTDYRALAGRVIGVGKQFATEPILKRTFLSLGVASVVLLGVGFIFGGNQSQSEPSEVLSGTTEINFEPITPAESEEEVTFDTIVGAAIVRDDIDGAPIVISQQALPENVKNNPDELEQVAQSIPDVLRFESFSTDAGRVHLATSYNGNQAAVFAYEDKLITMTSQMTIYAIDWSDYINDLIP